MYDKIKKRYDLGWITLEQLGQYVVLGVITAEQYETICGEPYE